MARALVIDDDDVARELLVSILRQGGYQTFELPSPIGATQTIFQQRIDVLVLDVMMAALRGDKLAQMLRSNRRLPGLIIILVSSCGVEELAELAASAKVDAVLAKDDVRKRLLAVVADARSALHRAL